MCVCKICGESYISNHYLAGHIRTFHKIPRKEYYDIYLRQNGEGYCKECGKETTFRGNKYLSFCSRECYNISPDTAESRALINKGRKQSQEIIEKRLANTDQQKKEETRKATLFERYGDSRYVNREKIGKSHLGKKRPPRTKEHSDKITESKRRNGTNTHSETTKKSLSKMMRDLYARDDAPVTISKNNTYVCGYYNDIYYRSSYELIFIKYCANNNIEIVSADTKEFRIRYYDAEDGRPRFYYPDFYIPQYDLMVEIKPLSMLDYGNNQVKSCAAREIYRYMFITEEELEDLDEVFRWV